MAFSWCYVVYQGDISGSDPNHESNIPKKRVDVTPFENNKVGLKVSAMKAVNISLKGNSVSNSRLFLFSAMRREQILRAKLY